MPADDKDYETANLCLMILPGVEKSEVHFDLEAPALSPLYHLRN